MLFDLLHIRIGSCWQSPPTPYLSPYNDPPLCHTNLTHALLSMFSAIYHLYDKSALAEVECYRINKKKLKREYEELQQVQHDIWKRELTIGGCARRLARARVYQRIEVVNRAKLRILMDEYKARRHGRRS